VTRSALSPAAREKLAFLVGDEKALETMQAVQGLPVFAEEVLSFFDDLSGLLARRADTHSDVAAFGFWCRRRNLLELLRDYPDHERRLGKGVVFHSTPSNVPVNFAFSFASGLLAGNANVVRVPATDFPQVAIIAGAIRELLEGAHANLKPYIVMVRFATDGEILDYLSAMSATRIIWGSDETIERYRLSPLPPRSSELSFADRYSIAVMNSGAYLDAPDKERIVERFYRDTFALDQNACSSPRVVVWLGDRVAWARKEFWTALHEVVSTEYTLSDVVSVGKLAALCRSAMDCDIAGFTAHGQLIHRLEVTDLNQDIEGHFHHSGFFFEYEAKSLDEIAPLCGGKCQTLTYYGVSPSELSQFVRAIRPAGVDRVVPVGAALDFTLNWDGHDLIRSLSRIVEIR
jgi:hypothetical protein